MNAGTSQISSVITMKMATICQLLPLMYLNSSQMDLCATGQVIQLLDVTQNASQMMNAVTTMTVTSALMDFVTLTGPAHGQKTASAPLTLTVLTMMGCATCLRLIIQITVLTVTTMASVQEDVLTWVVIVPTAPQPILIAMETTCVSHLCALPIRNAVMTLIVPSAMVENATMTLPAHTHQTAAQRILTVFTLMVFAMCLPLTPRITVLIVKISIVLEAVLT